MCVTSLWAYPKTSISGIDCDILKQVQSQYILCLSLYILMLLIMINCRLFKDIYKFKLNWFTNQKVDWIWGSCHNFKTDKNFESDRQLRWSPIEKTGLPLDLSEMAIYGSIRLYLLKMKCLLFAIWTFMNVKDLQYYLFGGLF